MKRSSFNNFVAAVAVIVAVALTAIGVVLGWASGFANSQVSSQLSQQKITMPAGAAITALANKSDQDALTPYAGQPLTTGDQAKVYADNYIYAHMMKSSGGKQYQEVSGAYNAKNAELAKLSPTDANYAAVSAETATLKALRTTLFEGNALRSMLLTAYAFGVMGSLANTGAIVLYVLAAVLLAVGGFYFYLAGKAKKEEAQA